jgi:DNA-binding beta-propeller fold protein YncE
MEDYVEDLNALRMDYSLGYLYISSIYQVHKFNSATGGDVYINHFGSQGAEHGQFNYIRSIAADGAGNLFVAEYQNNRIQKFDENGNFLGQWGFGETEQPCRIMPWPQIAVDKSGFVYVMDYYDSSIDGCRIKKFTGDGRLVALWIMSRESIKAAVGKYPDILAMTVDDDGNLYLLDNGNGGVLKYKAP